jgi:hypothetical protein
MKKCIKCKIEKELTDFRFIKKTNKYWGTCKKCRKEYNKEYREKRKEYLKEKRKEYYKNNKEEFRKNSKKYREKNKEKIKELHKEYYKNNKEYLKEYHKEYREKNKEYLKEYWKKYRENNKEKIKEYDKEYIKKNKHKIRAEKRKYENNKRKTDPLYKMKCNLRTRIYSAFKRATWRKGDGTEKLLGCSFKTAHKHIERQFTKGMTWDNHGEWHIDHIMPLASAKTEEELKKLCHYRNLQPLWGEDNKSKGATIPNVQIQLKI